MSTSISSRAVTSPRAHLARSAWLAGACVAAGFAALAGCSDNSDDRNRDPGDDTGTGDVGVSPCDGVSLTTAIFDTSGPLDLFDPQTGVLTLPLNEHAADLTDATVRVWRYYPIASQGGVRPPVDATTTITDDGAALSVQLTLDDPDFEGELDWNFDGIGRIEVDLEDACGNTLSTRDVVYMWYNYELAEPREVYRLRSCTQLDLGSADSSSDEAPVWSGVLMGTGVDVVEPLACGEDHGDQINEGMTFSWTAPGDGQLDLEAGSMDLGSSPVLQLLDAQCAPLPSNPDEDDLTCSEVGAMVTWLNRPVSAGEVIRVLVTWDAQRSSPMSLASAEVDLTLFFPPVID